MSVPYCYICKRDPTDSRSNQTGSLDHGTHCPVCHQPVCRAHTGTVRWRWKNSGMLDSARVCLDCKNTYRHREWDPIHRDWIS